MEETNIEDSNPSSKPLDDFYCRFTKVKICKLPEDIGQDCCKYQLFSSGTCDEGNQNYPGDMLVQGKRTPETLEDSVDHTDNAPLFDWTTNEMSPTAYKCTEPSNDDFDAEIGSSIKDSSPLPQSRTCSSKSHSDLKQFSSHPSFQNVQVSTEFHQEEPREPNNQPSLKAYEPSYPVGVHKSSSYKFVSDKQNTDEDNRYQSPHSSSQDVLGLGSPKFHEYKSKGSPHEPSPNSYELTSRAQFVENSNFVSNHQSTEKGYLFHPPQSDSQETQVSPKFHQNKARVPPFLSSPNSYEPSGDAGAQFGDNYKHFVRSYQSIDKSCMFQPPHSSSEESQASPKFHQNKARVPPFLSSPNSYEPSGNIGAQFGDISSHHYDRSHHSADKGNQFQPPYSGSQETQDSPEFHQNKARVPPFLSSQKSYEPSGNIGAQFSDNSSHNYDRRHQNADKGYTFQPPYSGSREAKVSPKFYQNKARVPPLLSSPNSYEPDSQVGTRFGYTNPRRFSSDCHQNMNARFQHASNTRRIAHRGMRGHQWRSYQGRQNVRRNFRRMDNFGNNF